MPSVIHLVVRCAKALPVDDDPQTYVEASLRDLPEQRTSKNTKGTAENPVWNETLTLEVSDDLELQDFPLLIECKRGDDGEVIGSLSLDFGTLLQGNHLAKDSEQTLQGWFPLFETLSGIQGFLFLTVKFRFVDDRSDMDHSSLGVKFFSISTPPQPEMCEVDHLFGLVEVLKVVQDPEYHWRDLIRSSRASNNERLNTFKQISLQARRDLAKKCIFYGGNAVLGYREQVDLEGDITDRICIRAYGTAATLCLIEDRTMDPNPNPNTMDAREKLSLAYQSRCSDSTLKGLKLATPLTPGHHSCKRNIELITLDRLPMNCSISIGGAVSVRAVKLLSGKTALDKRQQWWHALREELRSHAQSMGGDHIVGYHEQVTFQNELVILSVMGTACTLVQQRLRTAESWCHMVHRDFTVRDLKEHDLKPCCICGYSDVGSFLLATIDVPEGMPVVGQGALVEARVVRSKRDLVGESHASEVSEALPFLELELHKTLLYKLRARCMNAAFGLRIDISVGQTIITGVASATGIFCAALPKPARMTVSVSDLYTTRADVVPSKPPPVKSGFRGIFRRKKDARLTRQKPSKDTKETAASSNQNIVNCINAKLEYYASLFPSGFHDDNIPANTIQFCASFDYSPTKLRKMWHEQRRTKSSDSDPDFRSRSWPVNPVDGSVSSTCKADNVFVFEIEDATDEDLICALLDDPSLPKDMAICNTDCLPGVNSDVLRELDPFQTTMMYGISRLDLTEGVDETLTSRERGATLSKRLGKVMNDMYSCMLLKHELRTPSNCVGPLRCCLSSVSWRMHCVTNDTVELVLVGQLMTQKTHDTNKEPFVLLSPLSAIPTRKVHRHFGLVSVHMIKETTSLKRGYQESLQVFYHQFLAEAICLARAHVSSCGGNALLGYRISNLYLRHVDKRRAYAVLSILGDAVILGAAKITSPQDISMDVSDNTLASPPDISLYAGGLPTNMFTSPQDAFLHAGGLPTNMFTSPQEVSNS